MRGKKEFLVKGVDLRRRRKFNFNILSSFEKMAKVSNGIFQRKIANENIFFKQCHFCMQSANKNSTIFSSLRNSSLTESRILEASTNVRSDLEFRVKK